MGDGEPGHLGAPAVKPVETEQKQEPGNVTPLLQLMVDSLVLEEVLQHGTWSHATVKHVQVNKIFSWDFWKE